MQIKIEWQKLIQLTNFKKWPAPGFIDPRLS